MNNPKSVAYGWGVLTAAGAFAYYIAKKEIDERRKNYFDKQEQLTWEQKITKDIEAKGNQDSTAHKKQVSSEDFKYPSGEGSK